MDHDLPSQALEDHWAEVTSDLDATAAELAAEGWTTVSLHPGDVTTHPGGDDRAPGLDVLIPDNEFDALVAELTAGAAFDESAVYRQAAGGVAFLICVLRDPDRMVAALVPVYYPQRGRDAMALADHATDVGDVHLHLQPLRRDRVVTVTIDDPSLVFPRD